MKRMLINATQLEELRVALVDGHRLYDLNIENQNYEQKKSNIYKGIISRIEPSLEAAFIEYGSEKHGFLPKKEISNEYFLNKESQAKNQNIKNLLKEGQEIIIQINKEERGNKGAALTTFISLAGSYLVLMPNNPRANGISRRIGSIDRLKLKEILSLLKIPENMGLIIRTAGVGKSIEDLKQDLKDRLKHWEAIKKIAKNKNAPFLIHQEDNIIIRAFRDYLKPDIEEILIDNSKIFKIAKNYIKAIGRKDFLNKIKYYKKDIPLFTHYQIESQIETAFQRKVRLPSGGILVIDTTEALTAIDINSSKSTKGTDIKETAFNTNLEAVEEITRQLRLRDLGGLIVIDFIDMTPIKHQREIENKLKEAIKHDKAKIRINRISRFGLLEMSRQRLNSSLCESSHHICPRCNGKGKIRNNKSLSLSILRLIEEEALKNNTYEVRAIAPIEIASYLLNEKRYSINEIEKRQNNIKIIIVPNNNIEPPHFSVIRIKKGEIFSNCNYHTFQHNEIESNTLSKECFSEKKIFLQNSLYNSDNKKNKKTKNKKIFIITIAKKINIFFNEQTNKLINILKIKNINKINNKYMNFFKKNDKKFSNNEKKTKKYIDINELKIKNQNNHKKKSQKDNISTIKNNNIYINNKINLKNNEKNQKDKKNNFKYNNSINLNKNKNEINIKKLKTKTINNKIQNIYHKKYYKNSIISSKKHNNKNIKHQPTFFKKNINYYQKIKDKILKMNIKFLLFFAKKKLYNNINNMNKSKNILIFTKKIISIILKKIFSLYIKYKNKIKYYLNLTYNKNSLILKNNKQQLHKKTPNKTKTNIKKLTNATKNNTISKKLKIKINYANNKRIFYNKKINITPINNYINIFLYKKNFNNQKNSKNKLTKTFKITSHSYAPITKITNYKKQKNIIFEKSYFKIKKIGVYAAKNISFSKIYKPKKTHNQF